MSVADEMFEAQLALGRAEERVDQVLEGIYGPDGWDSFTCDPYDASIEVYDVQPRDVADLAALAHAGFERVWQHPHKAPRGNCKCPHTVLATRKDRVRNLTVSR